MLSFPSCSDRKDHVLKFFVIFLLKGYACVLSILFCIGITVPGMSETWVSTVSPVYRTRTMEKGGWEREGKRSSRPFTKRLVFSIYSMLDLSPRLSQCLRVNTEPISVCCQCFNPTHLTKTIWLTTAPSARQVSSCPMLWQRSRILSSVPSRSSTSSGNLSRSEDSVSALFDDPPLSASLFPPSAPRYL